MEEEQDGSFSGHPSSGGGGASDIRVGTDSLFSRVIVAGGGRRFWLKPWTRYAK